MYGLRRVAVASRWASVARSVSSRVQHCHSTLSVTYTHFVQIVFHLDYNLAYTIGYIISFFFNFLASTFFTFKAEASTKNGIKFAGAHLINYFLHILLLNLFIFINIPSEIAPIFVFPIAIVINFFMVRFALKK